MAPSTLRESTRMRPWLAALAALALIGPAPGAAAEHQFK